MDILETRVGARRAVTLGDELPVEHSSATGELSLLRDVTVD